MEKNCGPFVDHERLTAELPDFRFDLALQHAHDGHHDDDGKHTHENAEQGEGRA
jgi:hypothetical protein